MTRSTHLSDPTPFSMAIERFLRAQEGRNRSPQTIRAYRSDLTQLAAWLREDNPLLTDPADVTADDLNAFLAHLAHEGLTGVSRARKLAATREFFRFLKISGAVSASPVEGVDTPKRERRGRSYLTPEEYNRLLAAAGGNPRDFCILTLFLQTGIRIGELVDLGLGDIDLAAGTLTLRAGKGMAARTIELEKKGFGRSRPGWRCGRPRPTTTSSSTTAAASRSKNGACVTCWRSTVGRRGSPSG